MSDPKRISASALKSLEQCSYSFYASRYLKLPERIWEKTSVGTVAHSILECLRYEKHRAHHDVIRATEDVKSSKAIVRMLRALQYKYKIADELMADVGPMIVLVLTKTNFLDVGAIRTFEPEHEFTLNLTNGAIIKGFIDKLAIYRECESEKVIVTDYKSQGRTFPKADLINNFQAMTYQLYIWKTFKLPASVEFVMLRHPPTSRTPQKHLQIVEPASPAQLAGFEFYLEHIYKVFQNFGLKDAYQSFCQDYGFCKNVCSFYKPFEYWSVTKKENGNLVANYPIDKPPQLQYDEQVERIQFKGCPAHSQR